MMADSILFLQGSEVRSSGDLQTPITNIKDVAEEDEKLAWVSLRSLFGQTPRRIIQKAHCSNSKLCLSLHSFYRQKKPDWAKTGPKMKATGKDAKGDLQTPITNIHDVAEEDDKLAWVSLHASLTYSTI